MSLDLRAEAEKRNSQRIDALAISTSIRNSQRSSKRVSASIAKEAIALSSQGKVLSTSEAAVLADIDYRLNGARARVAENEFVGPRWIPDEETVRCFNIDCGMEFDWYNRKHHCRNCGHIFCNSCSTARLLLPREFALRNPQRVCGKCKKLLLPLQQTLTNDIANHQRANSIEALSSSGARSLRRYLNMPFALTLGSELRKAAYTTHNLFTLQYVRDKSIPLSLLRSARGLAFLTVAKGGLVFGGRFGTGLVIAKLPSGKWSAPCAIGTLGVSWGALAGAELTDYVVILNDQDAVDVFGGSGQLALGAGVDVTVGPVGRTGSVGMHLGDGGIAIAFSYSHSRGAYAGMSLDGSFIFARRNVNFQFYGREVSPQEILRSVPPPKAAQPLYDALAHAFIAAPALM